jgi:hypothetical protein
VSPRRGTRPRPGTAEARLLCVLALLPLAACLEDRLSVEVFTQVQADGSCTRRIEYRLERTEDGKPSDIDPAKSPLRTLHRFPTGPQWHVDDDLRGNVHLVRVEGLLPSLDAAEGDFFRARKPNSLPARNFVSSRTDVQTESASYEYQEVFRDPDSPLRSMRFAARFLAQQDGLFAERFASPLGNDAPKRGDVRRLFRQQMADPLAAATATLAERPLFGPRERRELDRISTDVDANGRALIERLQGLAPGADPEDVDKAANIAFEELFKRLESAIDEAGLAPLLEDAARIHFRATLFMPAPITRANTCVSGDTAIWEFDEQDLYGHGFEMKALAQR